MPIVISDVTSDVDYVSVSTKSCVSAAETVPEPLNGRTKEVSYNSFRVSWQHPATDVVLYKLLWGESDGDGDVEEVSVFLPVSCVSLPLFRCVCLHTYLSACQSS